LSTTEPVVGVTVTLRAVPTVAFAGHIVSPRGVPQPIDAIVLKGTPGVAPLGGTAQSDGSFTFERVAPGDYTAEIGLPGSGPFEAKVTVPVDGSRSARIVIPELRQLSARLRIDEPVTAGARPAVTVRFAGEGTLTSLIVDGSSGETPLQFTLRDGQYRVTATIRGSIGTGKSDVKTLTSGDADLLQAPLQVSEDSPKEVLISIGR
jgi:hypothetical protein